MRGLYESILWQGSPSSLSSVILMVLMVWYRNVIELIGPDFTKRSVVY